MANTKISKKSLKEPDEFISFSSRMLQLAVAHKTKTIWAVTGFLGIVLITSGIHYYSQKAENKGSETLTRIMNQYESSERMSGPKIAYETVMKDFQKLLEDYSQKDCGKFARLLFAGISFRAGDIDNAIPLFSQSKKDYDREPFLKNIAAIGLGYAYENKKEYSKAAEVFEALSSDPNLIMADEAMFALGRLYGLMQKNDLRAQVMGKLKSNYPNSIYKDLYSEIR